MDPSCQATQRRRQTLFQQRRFSLADIRFGLRSPHVIREGCERNAPEETTPGVEMAVIWGRRPQPCSGRCGPPTRYWCVLSCPAGCPVRDHASVRPPSRAVIDFLGATVRKASSQTSASSSQSIG
jgi:hypothetical protein